MRRQFQPPRLLPAAAVFNRPQQLQKFFEEMLFTAKVSIYDPALVARLSDSDVREHVRATFLPLIRAKTIREEKRLPSASPLHVSEWRPFQATASERRPVKQADRTLFNLVPCNRSLEQAFVEFLEKAEGVSAFAKNAGPQCLRIDYLADGRRLAFYTPDFLVRMSSGHYLLVETKGPVGRETAPKARAAIAWCQAATTKSVKWDYLYVPEKVFQQFHGGSIAELIAACGPALADLLTAEQELDQMPLFAGVDLVVLAEVRVPSLVDEKLLAELPPRLRKAADDAMELFRFLEKKQQMSFTPAFNPLLGVIDEAARGLVCKKLQPLVPQGTVKERDWFEPHYGKIDGGQRRHYEELARNLRKTLVLNSGVSPLGLLRNCLDHALNDRNKPAGVFDSIRTAFKFTGSRKLLDSVQAINDFRNTRVAHQEHPLTDPAEAKTALIRWIDGLTFLWKSGQE